MKTPSLRIFVSHSSKDHQFCQRLVNDLRKVLGDEDAVWYDQSGGLLAGDSWWRKIEQELSTRNIFIVVLSPEAVNSKWVNDEIDIAWRRKNDQDFAKRMRLFPVMYQPCEIRLSLGSLQIISFVIQSYEDAFRELLRVLEIPTSTSMNQATQQAPITPQKTNEELLREKNSRKRRRQRTLTPQKTNEELLQALEIPTSQKTNEEERLQILGIVARTFNSTQRAPITPQKTKEQWVDEGNTHFNAEQYEKAIADYDRAIELDPLYANAYYNRGLAHYHIGYFDKYEKAIADYSRAIQLDPNLASAHYSRGYVYRDLKQYEQAIADYSRAIQLVPNFPDAYLQRGFVYRDRKQYEQAIVDWNRALQLAPQYTVVYKHRAGAYFVLGLYQQAIADYDRAIQLEPQYTALQGMREQAWLRLLGMPGAY